MNVLTINTGSSSVRLAMHRGDAGRLLASDRRRIVRNGPDGRDGREERGGDGPAAALASFLTGAGAPGVDAAAHRVVHGGAKLVSTCRIDGAVESEIERLAALAPLHNPAALAWIRAARDVLGPSVPQLAVFDTAFFAALPARAATYALPRALSARHGLRRYGFHGLAHRSMWEQWQAASDRDGAGRAITLQLGGGCSIAAIHGGRPVDVSMGLTPLEGLVMETRSGDVDPGLLLYLQRAERLQPSALERMLDQESGLLGLTGRGETGTIAASTDPDDLLALDVYCYRARKYVGAYLTALGGADAVLFGGGVGEHLPAVRGRILDGMRWCGLALDPVANAGAASVRGPARVSAAGSSIEAWVVHVDEESLLAREAVRALGAHAPQPRT